MAEQWLTVNEAAEISGYHPVYLRRLIRGGEITAEKKGNAWWVDRKALLAYLEAAQKSSDRRWGPKVDKA
jgi:excisionase family DNA binding protein